MRILAQYVAGEFLKLFCFLILSFVAIYTIFDFIEKVDNFQEASVASGIMTSFFILQIPEITSLLMPVAVLMATVLTLGMMSKRNEIVSIKSSGISLLRYALPIVLLAGALTLGLAWLNENVLPETKSKTNFIWDVLVEKRPKRLYHMEKFWYKGQNSIYHVGFFDEKTSSLSAVVYYHFDSDFNLDMRVDARRARYLGGRWVFFEGLLQKRMEGGGYSATPFKEMAVHLPERPGDFTRLIKPSEEMSFAELRRYLSKIEAEGYDARRYRVDMQARISYPFVCLVMAIIGIPLALFKERGRALAPGVVLGLGASLIYWTGFSYVKLLFGYSGVMPPALAVWLPNLVFIIFGLWFLASIRQ